MIIVDDAIAYAEQALAGLGEVHRLPGTAIGQASLTALAAEALIVRSVTRVDAALLDAAPHLRFVGTATAGIDHLDIAVIEARGLSWASAAGCNAQAVAEWVVAALYTTFAGQPLPGPIGVVGFGQVGTRLARLLRRLGHELLVCDPPRARAGDCDEALIDFDELWQRCPIVSFHVPLTLAGPDATAAYVDVDKPAIAGPKLLINSSRGPVIPDRALDRPDISEMILDVWEGEPELRWARLADPRLRWASPHVAGYSLEAKVAGTRMMHEALARAWGRTPSWTGAELLPPRTLDGPRICTPHELLGAVVELAADDARLRALAGQERSTRAGAFEALRRGYRLRREFSAWTVAPAETLNLGPWLAAAGFSPARGRG